jgi:hypothetical protein
MRIFFFSGLVVAAVYTSVACSSSSDSPSGTGGSSGAGGGGQATGGKGGGTSGGAVVDGGCVDTSQVFNGVDKCLEKSAAVAQCKTDAVKSVAGTKVDDPTCGAGCTCDNCTAEMFACANDPEGYCPKILACSQAHNCTGVACYAPATCMDVIDLAPPCGSDGKCTSISSVSVALASEVSDCATKTAKHMGREGAVCPASCTP